MFNDSDRQTNTKTAICLWGQVKIILNTLALLLSQKNNTVAFHKLFSGRDQLTLQLMSMYDKKVLSKYVELTENMQQCSLWVN